MPDYLIWSIEEETRTRDGVLVWGERHTIPVDEVVEYATEPDGARTATVRVGSEAILGVPLEALEVYRP